MSPQDHALLEALNKQDTLMRQKIEGACGDGKARTTTCKDLIKNIVKPYYNTYPKSGLSKDLQAEKNAWADILRKYDVASNVMPMKPKEADPYGGGNPIKIIKYLNQHPELNTQHTGDPFGHQALNAAPGVVAGLGAIAVAGPAGGAAAGSTQAGRFASATISAVANATAQSMDPQKSEVSRVGVGIAALTGYLAPSYGFTGNVGLSVTGANAEKLAEGQIPTYSNMAASGLGAGFGYGLGKAGSSIQWTPVKTSTGTSWQLPSSTDRLPSWVLPVTTSSNAPAQLSEFVAPFVEQSITPKIEKILTPVQKKGQ